MDERRTGADRRSGMRDVRAALDAAEHEQDRIAESAERWQGRYADLVTALRRDAVVLALGPDGEVVEAEGPVEEVLGIGADELVERFEEIVDDGGRKALVDGNIRLRDGWAESAHCDAVFTIEGAEHRLRLLQVAVCDSEGVVVGVEAVASAASQGDQGAAGDTSSAAFEELLADASRRLLERPEGSSFERSLGALAEHFGLDRVVVNAYDEETRKFSVLAAWYQSGVSALAAEENGLSISELPWAYSILSAGESIVIAPGVDLPGEAQAEKRLYSGADIASAMLAPLVRNDHLAGFVSLQSAREDRSFNETEASLVRRFVATLSVALAHAEITEELEQAYRDADEADQRVADVSGELEETREAAEKANEEFEETRKAAAEASERIAELERKLEKQSRELKDAERKSEKAVQDAKRESEATIKSAEHKSEEALKAAEQKAQKAEAALQAAQQSTEEALKAAERKAQEAQDKALKAAQRKSDRELKEARRAAEEAERRAEEARRAADEAVETAEVAAKATDEADRTFEELRRSAADAQRARGDANAALERAEAGADAARRERDALQAELRQLRDELEAGRTTDDLAASGTEPDSFDFVGFDPDQTIDTGTAMAGASGFDPDATVEMETLGLSLAPEDSSAVGAASADDDGETRESGRRSGFSWSAEATGEHDAHDVDADDAIVGDLEAARQVARSAAGKGMGLDDSDDETDDEPRHESFDAPLQADEAEVAEIDEPRADHGWVRGKLAEWTSSKKSDESSWEDDTAETELPAAAGDELVSDALEPFDDEDLDDFDLLDDVAVEQAPLVDLDLAGLDVEAGIAEVGGNEELYRDMLIKFGHDYRGAGNKIGAAIEKGNIEVAHLLLHSIKGVAGVLGASQVHRCADELESSLIQPDEAVTRKDFEAFSSALVEVLASIGGLDDLSMVAAETERDA